MSTPKVAQVIPAPRFAVYSPLGERPVQCFNNPIRALRFARKRERSSGRTYTVWHETPSDPLGQRIE